MTRLETEELICPADEVMTGDELYALLSAGLPVRISGGLNDGGENATEITSENAAESNSEKPLHIRLLLKQRQPIRQQTQILRHQDNARLSGSRYPPDARMGSHHDRLGGCLDICGGGVLSAAGSAAQIPHALCIGNSRI